MINKIKEAAGILLKRTEPPIVFFDVDKEFHDLYVLAQKKTQMSSTDNLLRRQRHYTLTQLLKRSLSFCDKASVVECGCWRGLSSYQIAYHLKSSGFENKFFIFDSFSGLSAFEHTDKGNNEIKDEEKRRREFACPEEEVRENLKEFDFIEYKKGWIPERFKDVDKFIFSFVHIDVDLYQPIKDALTFFYPRMIKGGIIVLDDYGYLTFPGAKKAVDEFMKGRRDFFLHLPSSSAFIIKNSK